MSSLLAPTSIPNLPWISYQEWVVEFQIEKSLSSKLNVNSYV